MKQMMQALTAQWDASTGWSSPLPDWDGSRTLVIAFGGSDLDANRRCIADLARMYPTARVIGCSSAGEIRGDLVHDDCVVVAVARFETTSLHFAAEQIHQADDSYKVGDRLGRRLLESGEQLQAVFVLSDGLVVNGSELASGLGDAAGGEVTIFGGLAGDDDRFSSTWVLVDGEPRSGYVVSVGFSGPRIEVTCGSCGGWERFGPIRRVTRARGNVLYELDGKPALDLYKTYLGERAGELPGAALLFPLEVTTRGTSDPVVRTILAVDQEARSMTFAGDIPEGSTAQLMRAELGRLIDGARTAGSRAANSGPAAVDRGQDVKGAATTLAVAVSCVGRRLVLGQRSDDELEATLDALGSGTEMVGFYSYGEIATSESGCARLHNQTMTVTTLAERHLGS